MHDFLPKNTIILNEIGKVCDFLLLSADFLDLHQFLRKLSPLIVSKKLELTL